MRTNVETIKGHQRAGQKDAALLTRAKAGNRQALGTIYEQTYPEVWRTIRSMVKNEDDALDILQDTYVKALSRLDQLQDADSLRPWLRQAAANTARDHLRRKKPILFSEMQNESEDGELPIDLPDDRQESIPELRLDRKETSRLVNEMLDSLSEEQRMVVGMYYYQELPVKTIAEQLGVSQNTVKSQLRYARQKIEKRVRELERQGVKLYGAAPLVFFRMICRDGLGNAAPPEQLGKMGGKLAAGSLPSAGNAAGGMKVLTAKGMLLRRAVMGVGALAAACGIAVGAALLVRNLVLGDVRPPITVREEPVQNGKAFRPADWQEAFLGILAGRAPAGQDFDPEQELPQEQMLDDYERAVKGDYDRSNYRSSYYLADGTGDGIPELYRDQDLLLSSFCWTAEQTSFRQYLYDFYHSAPPAFLCQADGGILCCWDEGLMLYVSGTTGNWEINNDDLGTLPLPDYGSLATRNSQERIARLLAYSGTERNELLCRLTLEDSGEEYYLRIERQSDAELDNVEYLDAAAFQAEEQSLLASCKTRLPLGDLPEAEQLKDVPAAEVRGPYTYVELVDLLGGFPEGEEWSRGSNLYAALTADGETEAPESN